MAIRAAIPTENNFDLLRLLLAAVVALVHAYELTGLAGLRWISNILSPPLAVDSFFVVSGFLIFMSYDRSGSLLAYARNRVKRIYPAYAVVILGCALLLMFLSTEAASQYFSVKWLRYVLWNMVFLNYAAPTLPGVFENNLNPAVNGALWTLKIEVIFYFAVPVLFFLSGRFGKLLVFLSLYVLSVVYTIVCEFLARGPDAAFYDGMARQFPGQLQYFLVGAMLYSYKDFFYRRIRTAIPAICVLSVALDSLTGLSILRPIAIGTGIFFFVFFRYLGRAGRFGDFSYGVYIVHFPILQTLIAVGLPSFGAATFLGVSIAATGIVSAAMWHLVERRFLRARSHYVESAVR